MLIFIKKRISKNGDAQNGHGRAIDFARRISRDDKGYARTRGLEALDELCDATSGHDWMVAARLSAAGVFVSRADGGRLSFRSVANVLFLALLWKPGNSRSMTTDTRRYHVRLVAGAYLERYWI